MADENFEFEITLIDRAGSISVQAAYWKAENGTVVFYSFRDNQIFSVAKDDIDQIRRKDRVTLSEN